MSKQSTAHRTLDTSAVLAPMAALNGSFMNAFVHAGEAYAQACLEWQQEILRFVGSRFQCDGRVGEALAKCKTAGDIAEVQKNWLMAAAQEYSDEANRLTQIATKFVPSWMPSAVRHGAESKSEATSDAAE